MSKTRKPFNIIKFIGGTLTGILLVLIPFNFNGTVDTVLFYYLKVFINQYQSALRLILMLLMALSAVISLIDYLFKPQWIRDNKLFKSIFSTTPFYIANRFMGSSYLHTIYFKMGRKSSFLKTPVPCSILQHNFQSLYLQCSYYKLSSMNLEQWNSSAN